MKEEEIIKKSDKIADDTILFRVENGYNKLQEGRIKLQNNFKEKVLLLDKVPLIALSDENAPMNSTIIKIMRGREGVDKNIRERLNINRDINNIEGGFNEIKPILELLEDGDYELKELDMIPTDGENNYFWNSGMYSHYYNASADVYYRGKYVRGFPKFLVPSQGIECINMKRVEYYRQKIRNGERLFGVALNLRGFMALLLDGHHKATAAYLEGKNLKCLTIKRCTKKTRILDISKEEYENYKNFNINHKKIKIDDPKEVYPDFKAIAVTRHPVNASISQINNLFKFNSKKPVEDLEDVLYYLTIHDKKRAKNLCFEILKKNEFQIIWGICLEYLTRYKDKSVKALLKDILLDRNREYCMNYMNNLDIINRYLKKTMIR